MLIVFVYLIAYTQRNTKLQTLKLNYFSYLELS